MLNLRLNPLIFQQMPLVVGGGSVVIPTRLNGAIMIVRQPSDGGASGAFAVAIHLLFPYLLVTPNLT